MPFRIRFVAGDPALDRAPFAHLAGQVCAGRLPLDVARRRAVAWHILLRMNAAAVDRYDGAITTLALHDLPRAIALAELNWTIAQRLQAHHIIQGNCQNTLAWLYSEREDLDPAIEHYRGSLRSFEAVEGSAATLAGIRREIGAIYERKGLLDEAAAEYDIMEKLAVAPGSRDLQVEARNRRGWVRLNQGRIEEALAEFNAVLGLGDTPELAGGRETALGHRGVAYRLLGRLAEGERDLREALAICRQLAADDERDGASPLQRRRTQDRIGRHLGSLGSLLLARGRLDEAMEQIAQAIAIAEQTGDRAGAQQRQGNMGNLYQAMAQRRPGEGAHYLEQALDHHRRAVEIARARRDSRSLSTLLLNLGNDYRDMKRFDEAGACYDEAAALADRHSLVDTRWRIEYVRGGLCEDQDDPEAAYARYLAAIAGAEAQRGQIDVELRQHVWQDRANLYKRASLCCLRLRRADRLRRALIHTEQAKARYLADRLRSRQWVAQPEAAAPSDPELGPLADVWRDIRAASDRLDPDGAAVIFNVTEAGTLVFLVTGPAGGASRPGLAGWEGEADGRLWVRHFEQLNRLALQRILIAVDHEGRVSGGYLKGYYDALRTLRQKGADAEAKRRASERAQDRLTEGLAQIGREVLGAVDEALTGLGITRLVLMPNLGLGLLPLHACPRSPLLGGGALLDRYTISYAPSFRMLRHCQESRAGDKPGGAELLLVANPTGDLMWAEIEARLIAHRFPAGAKVTILDSGEDRRATLQAFLQAARGHRRIHLACHGSLNLSDPLQSALSLAPERPGEEARLTLGQILAGTELPQAQLVGMSACETAMIDPGSLADEYFSLPAGFLVSGAPTAIASLWFVDDLSTAMLMDQYYRQHLTQGAHPALALRQAQLWLRDLTMEGWTEYNAGLRSAHPVAFFLLERERRRRLGGPDGLAPHDCPFSRLYDWAAFTVVGDSGVMFAALSCPGEHVNHVL